MREYTEMVANLHDLPHAQFRVLMAIANTANTKTENRVWKSQNQLSIDAKKTPKTVRAALADLRRRGFIHVWKNSAESVRDVYVLNVDVLAAEVTAAQARRAVLYSEAKNAETRRKQEYRVRKTAESALMHMQIRSLEDYANQHKEIVEKDV